jgi:hypothetical protein
MEEEARLIRLEERILAVSSDMGDVKKSLAEIASALRSLAVLEEKHSTAQEAIKRCFKVTDEHEERIKAVEAVLPNLLLASGWIFKAVLGVLGLLGMAAIGSLIK